MNEKPTSTFVVNSVDGLAIVLSNDYQLKYSFTKASMSSSTQTDLASSSSSPSSVVLPLTSESKELFQKAQGLLEKAEDNRAILETVSDCNLGKLDQELGKIQLHLEESKIDQQKLENALDYYRQIQHPTDYINNEMDRIYFKQLVTVSIFIFESLDEIYNHFENCGITYEKINFK